MSPTEGSVAHKGQTLRSYLTVDFTGKATSPRGGEAETTKAVELASKVPRLHHGARRDQESVCDCANQCTIDEPKGLECSFGDEFAVSINPYWVKYGKSSGRAAFK